MPPKTPERLLDDIVRLAGCARKAQRQGLKPSGMAAHDLGESTLVAGHDAGDGSTSLSTSRTFTFGPVAPAGRIASDAHHDLLRGICAGASVKLRSIGLAFLVPAPSRLASQQAAIPRRGELIRGNHAVAVAIDRRK